MNVKLDEPLPVISGNVPALSAVPKGCHFCTRCPYVTEQCKKEEPPVISIDDTHKVKCWNYVKEFANKKEQNVEKQKVGQETKERVKQEIEQNMKEQSKQKVQQKSKKQVKRKE